MRYAFCHAGAVVSRRFRASILGTGSVRNRSNCRTLRTVSNPKPTWQATLSTKEQIHQSKTAKDTTDTPPAHSVQKASSAIVPLDSSTAFRTHVCGELRPVHVGTRVKLAGWAHAVRDRGGVLFILVRDRHGIVQATVSDGCPEAAVSAAKEVRLEYCVEVSGTVSLRDAAVVNEGMPTGRIEVVVDAFRIVNATVPMPFMISKSSKSDAAVEGSEETRLRYRYLDLRRPVLQGNLVARHRATFAARQYLDASGFIEVETPILTKATPEGARDYLVPSRVHSGKWYALPQSPQIYKQLLMVGGIDRYFQITKCFRDEDLRMDRQPEFTQVDLEMSFVSREDVMRAAEGTVCAMFARACPDTVVPKDIPRMSYDEAMRRFGVDAPDMRFAMELKDITDSPAVQASEFAPIVKAREKANGIVKALVYKDAAKKCSRKVIDGYTEFAKQYGVSGILYGKCGPDGTVTGPLGKISPENTPAILAELGAEDGDLVLCCAGNSRAVNAGLGRLRAKLGHESGLVKEGPRFAFVWVVDFPLFEYDDELSRYTSVHHPFTAPNPADLPQLLSGDTSDLGAIRSNAYDLVCNGSELGGGSIRICDAVTQQKVFECLDISEEEQQSKFGFLLDALAYGAPTHGGLALGLDRCVMHMTGAEGIRDVIAFPKSTSAADIMAGAPSTVPTDTLDELHVASTKDREE